MSRLIRNIIMVFFMLGLCSCIENDLSYPEAVAEIVSIELEGQKSVEIDRQSRTVTVVMGERADMSHVKLLSLTVTDGAQVAGGIPEYLDLREAVHMTLRIYEDFEWTITASQPVARYIRCDNQVGEAEIDPARKTAYVYVSENQSLLDVKINDMKLEPEGSVVKSTTGFVSLNGQSVPQTEPCVFPMVLDCVIMRYFLVEYEGQEIEWSVKFLKKAVSVGVSSVSPWAEFAFVRGTTDGKGTPVFEYCKAGETDWTSVADVEVSGTSVSAEIRGLDPASEYLIRLTNGAVTSAEVSFVTEDARQIPNLNFDSWYLDGKAWMPDLDAAEHVWDSANPGTAGLGIVPTTPEDKDVVKGKAARLETGKAMGMLAAGNIYVGRFVKIAGLGAELDWGYPFTSRPIALKGWYKYAPKVVDMAKDPYKDLIGQGDQCQIQILLTDWDGMFRINTSKKQFVDFDNDPRIIAHGSLVSADTDDRYLEFTIPLVYRNDRTPKYIVVVAAASRYGDYFTGAVGSVLKVDEFELIYDPAELTEEEFAEVFSRMPMN